MKLKDVIINYRHENKISQREFARRAGLSNSLISIIEVGYNPQTKKKMSLSLETYKGIADAMGITVHELFEQLDDDEIVELKPFFRDLGGVEQRIIIPDSDIFRKVIFAMSPTDYQTVMEIYDRTYKAMRERGEID